LTDDLAARAVEVARDVCSRLISPERVEKAAAAACTQTAFPRTTHWIPYAISQGYSGLAVLWGYLDSCFAAERWDLIGREHLELAARGAETLPGVPLGLFSGLSGLAFGAFQLSRGGTRYRRLLTALDEAIVPQAVAAADRVRAQANGLPVGDFDLISGLSGTGAYMLCRREEPGVAAGVSAVVEALLEVMGEEKGVPRWHTPVHLLWDEEVMSTYPQGNLNCGLAHGVPGILAFLAAALRSGIALPRMTEAIARTGDWLAKNRCDDEWGVNWPTAVHLVAADSPDGQLRPGEAKLAHHGPSRCAWCYGSPGIARSLWLAGEALDRDDFRDLAICAMEAVLRRPIPIRRIDSPTFCHGVSGLLAITLRFANDTGVSVFEEGSRVLTQQLLDSYQPTSLLGFRNIETDNREIDQPGLLDGAPGVALVLLAAATTAEPTWDRLFLLS
jgi:class I lanthipeptide synthase